LKDYINAFELHDKCLSTNFEYNIIDKEIENLTDIEL